MTPQGPPKWFKSQYSYHNIAIFTSCPKSPKWCHMVPKGLQNESLGTPKCPKVEPSGPQRVPKGAQSASKCAKRLPWETPWNASWPQSGQRWPHKSSKLAPRRGQQVHCPVGVFNYVAFRARKAFWRRSCAPRCVMISTYLYTLYGAGGRL